MHLVFAGRRLCKVVLWKELRYLYHVSSIPPTSTSTKSAFDFTLLFRVTISTARKDADEHSQAVLCFVLDCAISIDMSHEPRER